MSILVKALSVLKLADDWVKGDQTWHHPDDIRSREEKNTTIKAANNEAMKTFHENWNKPNQTTIADIEAEIARRLK